MARDWQLQKAGQKGVPASRSGAGRAVLSSATMQLWQPYVYVTIFLVALVAISCSQNTPLFPVACELNVLIVLDRSDSVKGGFNKSRKFVTDVSEELQIGPHKHRVAMIVYSGLNYRREIFPWNFAKTNQEFVRITNDLRAIGGTTNTKKVAVVTFANVGRTRTKFNLKRFKTQDEVLNAIAGLESHGGTTAIGEAIREGAKQSNEREGARPGIATKVMIVFTDGWSNKGPEPEVTAKEAVAAGYEIYSVSYTGHVENAVTINDYTLEAVASDLRHKYTDKTFDDLINKVRQRNLRCL
ncbi:von Willebrand factor type A domain protein [Teladorsagia circumcincta]|uniref:von Willebrand factor type A domain protein n=1 Tax=Teladorsagia circumcincta TaxID=45464 RepID=A0A2G9U3V1_TELCI|nr:von Willebrand factor type A domain protein [Teladorsagia circumcincta]